VELTISRLKATQRRQAEKGETGMKKIVGSRSHDDFIIEQLKKDDRFLETYLNEALSENEDHRVVLDMLRNAAQAADLNRQNLYKALSSEKGKPKFFTVNKIVKALGFHVKLVRNKQ